MQYESITRNMKRIISLAAFIIIVITTLWSTTGNFSDDDLPQLIKKTRYIEVFMNDFEMTAMNENGLPAYTLNGRYLERYNDVKKFKITQPVMQFSDADNQWTISADFALIDDKKNTVQLQDNVVMQQLNIEPAITIRTQNILVNTKTQTAQTQALIKITQGQSQLTSIGMVYNNITSELELSSSISGFYLPYD